jgi:hypothetical protein
MIAYDSFQGMYGVVRSASLEVELTPQEPSKIDNAKPLIRLGWDTDESNTNIEPLVLLENKPSCGIFM